MTQRPVKPEFVYAEWDEEYNTWAVFGLDSGFCYAQPRNAIEADTIAQEMNRNLPPLPPVYFLERDKQGKPREV